MITAGTLPAPEQARPLAEVLADHVDQVRARRDQQPGGLERVGTGGWQPIGTAAARMARCPAHGSNADAYPADAWTAPCTCTDTTPEENR